MENEASGAFDRTMNLILDAGQTLLENGGEVFRAQETMEIMARSFGVRNFNVYVLTNGIFASAEDPARGTVSLVRHVPVTAMHLGRVASVNELSREVADGRLKPAAAEKRLAEARALPADSPRALRLAAAVGAGGFAYLFGGTSFWVVLAAAVGGWLEMLICQALARHGINRLFTDIVAAAACTLWALAVQLVCPAMDANAAIIGALMVLTPGVALTMGIRDILNADYLSGAIRLLDAVLIAGCIACGVALAWLATRGLGGAIW